MRGLEILAGAQRFPFVKSRLRPERSKNMTVSEPHWLRRKALYGMPLLVKIHPAGFTVVYIIMGTVGKQELAVFDRLLS
jgi:hypothetical protein